MSIKKKEGKGGEGVGVGKIHLTKTIRQLLPVSNMLYIGRTPACPRSLSTDLILYIEYIEHGPTSHTSINPPTTGGKVSKS